MCAQGSPGLPGRNGAKGEKGVPGSPGRRGFKGEAGPVGKVAAEERNWKQCVWEESDNRDIGLIKVSGRQLQIFFYLIIEIQKRFSYFPVLSSLLTVILVLNSIK